MAQCPICTHQKIEAINQACLSGRYFAVIARQFRLEKEAMRIHAYEQHFAQNRFVPNDELQAVTGQVRDMPPYVEILSFLEMPPWKKVQQALQQAKHDRRELQRILDCVNAFLLEQDEMGL